MGARARGVFNTNAPRSSSLESVVCVVCGGVDADADADAVAVAVAVVWCAGGLTGAGTRAGAGGHGDRAGGVASVVMALAAGQ